MKLGVFRDSGISRDRIRSSGSIPARDAIGKEDGFRRPGYIVSAEPGLVYMPGKTTIGLNVPVALLRDRVRSVYDSKTGRHGDAAFADFAIFFTVAHRL